MVLDSWSQSWLRGCTCFILVVPGLATSTTSTTSNGNTTLPPILRTTSSSTGLQPADIVAITLGCVLGCLIVLGVVACLLYRKGRVDDSSAEEPKLPPGVPAFSTTPESLRRMSMEAIYRSRQPVKQSHVRESKQPTIYMFNDVYHPPNSRPLPWNNVPAERYEDYARSVRKSQMRRKHKMATRTSRSAGGTRGRPPLPHKRKHRDHVQHREKEQHREHVPPPDGNHLKMLYPCDGQVNFTFHGTPAPYDEWKRPYSET